MNHYPNEKLINKISYCGLLESLTENTVPHPMISQVLPNGIFELDIEIGLILGMSGIGSRS